MSLEANMEAECALCLVGECDARAVLLPSPRGRSTPDPDTDAVDPTDAVEHVIADGVLCLQPSSLGLCVVTLDAGKGPRAGDELHDAVAELPVASTTGLDGERQLWYVAPATGVREGRWKHGRTVWKAGVVGPRSLVGIVTGIAKRDRRRHRPANLEALPAAAH